jgi:hypothetical protein
VEGIFFEFHPGTLGHQPRCAKIALVHYNRFGDHSPLRWNSAINRIEKSSMQVADQL